MTLQLSSPRLRLRPITTGDIDELHQLFVEPGVRRFLWDDEIVARSRVVEMVETSGRLFREQARGLWGVRGAMEARTAGAGAASGSLIGFGGFWDFHQPPQTELVLGLSQRFWRQGLATELAVCLLDHAFEALGHEIVLASADTPHEASRRLMEKLGMTFWRRASADGRETSIYRLQRAEWAAANYSGAPDGLGLK